MHTYSKRISPEKKTKRFIDHNYNILLASIIIKGYFGSKHTSNVTLTGTTMNDDFDMRLKF